MDKKLKEKLVIDTLEGKIFDHLKIYYMQNANFGFDDTVDLTIHYGSGHGFEDYSITECENSEEALGLVRKLLAENPEADLCADARKLLGYKQKRKHYDT